MGCSTSKNKTRKKVAVAVSSTPDRMETTIRVMKPVGDYDLDVAGVESDNEGEHVDSPIEDRPTVELKNGVKYTGQWKGTKKHGKGRQEYSDGAVFEGNWENGLAHGYGEFTHPDGKSFKGEYRCGKAHGHGVCIQPKEFVTRYEGEWKDDVRHGYGKDERRDGTSYEGHFLDGKMHGRGTLKLADGSTYNGEFKADELNGWGYYVWSDRSYCGEWVDNLMQGWGIFKWEDGRQYRGEYNQGKKDGWGIFSWPDGRQYSGWWRENKHHGYGRFRSAKGEERHAEYNTGSRIRWLEGEDIEQYKIEHNVPEEPTIPVFPEWLEKIVNENPKHDSGGATVAAHQDSEDGNSSDNSDD